MFSRSLSDHSENAVRAVMATAMQAEFEAFLEQLEVCPAEQFSTTALWITLKKPKPMLAGLMYHIRHVAYHRGQVKMVLAGMKLELIK